MLSVLVFAVLPVVPDCAPPQEPQLEILGSVISGAREVVNATHVATDPAVVALLEGGELLCSGTLISPTVVVTAAHCFDGAMFTPQVYFGDDTRVRTGLTVGVDEIAVHPGWNGVSNDIALVRLAAPVPFTPKPLIAPGDTDRLTGELMRIVGFGRTSADGSAGVKLEGLARVSALTPTILTHVPAPSATCNGDSGGPGFVIRDGVEVLAAVHVIGSCGGESLKTRIDAHLDSFITPFLNGMPIPRPAPAPTPAPVLTPEPDGPPPTQVLRDPNDPDQVFVYALWHFSTRDYATACPALRRYIELAPTGKFSGSARTNMLPACAAW